MLQDTRANFVGALLLLLPLLHAEPDIAGEKVEQRDGAVRGISHEPPLTTVSDQLHSLTWDLLSLAYSRRTIDIVPRF